MPKYITDWENKKCTKCKVVYPRTTEYFYRDRNNGVDGLGYICKLCSKPQYSRIGNDYGTHKKCFRCGEVKPRTELFFHKDKRIKEDGFKGVCKECKKKEYIPKPPIDRNNKKCPHCGVVYPRTTEYFHKNGNNGTLYGLKNLCKACERDKINKYEIKKYRNNIEFRIKKILRTRIKRVLGRKNKTDKMLPMLGCTINVFLRYIESLWVGGMNWDNYGYNGWHIDHIIPCALFDLSNIEEQKKCFHYTNLQPLWGKDNMAKGSLYKGIRYKKAS